MSVIGEELSAGNACSSEGVGLRKGRPTWAEVSLSKLRANFRSIRQDVGPQIEVCAVVKGDAYRHGIVECASALQAEGAQWFGVTSTEEGVQLRQAGIRGRILIMAGFWRGDEDEIIEHRLTPAVWEPWHLESLGLAARRRHSPIRVHLKVDTGMSRLGMLPEDLATTAVYFRSYPELVLEGVFTHLASAETPDAPDLQAQIDCFRQTLEFMHQTGISAQWIHAANSAAIVSRHDSWNTMVRPGISLYGYYLPFTSRREVKLPKVSPVLSWKSRIVSLRTIAAGRRVGYGGTYTAARSSRIGVLPVGYADGLSRQLSSRGRVLVKGNYAPIVGRISMDLTLVDVTDVPGVQIGEEVILIGACGDRSITASDHAALAATIPYEILCNISKRVPRLFLE
ncbi:MAG: alanine racemase [Acidobacteriaceae bacterium]